MTDGEKQQIQQILELPCWSMIEELLLEPMDDLVNGRYEDIAINVLAKEKARVHILGVLNKLKRLSGGLAPKESFK